MERSSPDPFAPAVVPLVQLAGYYGCDPRTLERRLNALGIPITYISARKKAVKREHAQEFAARCEAAAA